MLSYRFSNHVHSNRNSLPWAHKINVLINYITLKFVIKFKRLSKFYWYFAYFRHKLVTHYAMEYVLIEISFFSVQEKIVIQML